MSGRYEPAFTPGEKILSEQANKGKGPVSQILCAMVTFNGRESVSRSIKALSRAASWPFPVLIVDNDSSDDTVEIISALSQPGLSIERLQENIGVAGAYNLILERAKSRGFRWLFILDQDSLCVPGCLELLHEQAEALIREGEKLGAVCPTVFSRHFPDVVHPPYEWDGTYLRMLVYPKDQERVRVCSGISSGTLYLVKALDQVGGFRENFFIDFVDHDCHLRLHRVGWKMWWIRQAMLGHELGTRQQMTPDGLWIEHEPFRYYYIARNSLSGFMKYGGYRGSILFLNDLRKHVLKLRRYGRSPGASIMYMIKGIFHGLAGRFGPM